MADTAKLPSVLLILFPFALCSSSTERPFHALLNTKLHSCFLAVLSSSLTEHLSQSPLPAGRREHTVLFHRTLSLPLPDSGGISGSSSTPSEIPALAACSFMIPALARQPFLCNFTTCWVSPAWWFQHLGSNLTDAGCGCVPASGHATAALCGPKSIASSS